ncbi:isoaspartyl peptidase/L-asparaginase [Undibacterium sp. CY18W]|uniref:Isoaspartyl peptidase/L-asparaginase n=1 Tax=Undibacterium hunanense TaxID=2762292 RepID=A0ABR6ZQ50_9BURK|nr:isoaspartyl peptidase/L-asparaginase [Undibacterium hunanense]MBC3918037.1 isoaspartyl peptidase/L-asparaginase [Undibacterium hunanense]
MKTKASAGIAIHGGAGTILRSSLTAEQEQTYLTALHDIVVAGARILADGGSALDAVTVAVSLLEDCPLFNAGKGSVYTSAGQIEMDAAIMDGQHRRAGAVACVTNLRNPVRAARMVMEHSPHVLMVGPGAEQFVRKHGAQIEDATYFHTEQRYVQLLRARQEAGMLLDHDADRVAAESGTTSDTTPGTAPKMTPEAAPLDPDKKFGTVGAVALDMHGNLAAATSTGGMTNKLPGRVGDTAMLGAGCYADNRTAALSATGTGEAFMRSLALHDIAAQMDYTGLSLEQAAYKTVMEKLPQLQGRGGVIGIDRQGNIVLPFNTEGMYRASMHIGDVPLTGIYRDFQKL